jgi:hypothetical protein
MRWHTGRKLRNKATLLLSRSRLEHPHKVDIADDKTRQIARGVKVSMFRGGRFQDGEIRKLATNLKEWVTGYIIAR